MPDAPNEPGLPHLLAVTAALGLAFAGFSIASPWLESGTKEIAAKSISEPLAQRDQGFALQAESFASAHVLPVIGSSELTLEVPNRCTVFFKSAPTGFRVSPIGKAGNSTLVMAEKIAALGDVVRGKKLAIIISFTWFKRPQAPEDQYAGNFSPLQAVRIATDERLDPKLKRTLAARMLDYPSSLEGEPLLATYLDALRRDESWAKWKGHASLPFVKTDLSMLSWEDRFARSFELKTHAPVLTKAKAFPTGGVDWDRLITKAELAWPSGTDDPRLDATPSDPATAEFIASLEQTREWEDFTLLLDVLKHYDARPMIISVPLAGSQSERRGVSSEARDRYYRRVEALCRERNMPVEVFRDHDRDRGFIIGGTTHPTPKGWLFINRTLDDFYHDRLPSTLKPTE